MSRFLKSFVVALTLAAAPALLTIPSQPVQAQAADAPVAQVRGFYDALTASMKMGGSAKGRYDKLRPAVEKAFDLPAMTATAIGPSFAAMSDADKTICPSKPQPSGSTVLATKPVMNLEESSGRAECASAADMEWAT